MAGIGFSSFVLLACLITAVLTSLVTYEQCGGNSGGYCYYLGRCIGGTRCSCMDGWTGVDCTIPIDCGDIAEIIENVILPPAYYSNYGSMVDYKCKHRHQLPGVEDEDVVYQRLLRCQENGAWGPGPVSCVPICDPIPTWSGYTVESPLSRLSGATVTYGCKGWYRAYHNYTRYLHGKPYYAFQDGDNGTKTTTCSDKGQWDPPLTSCISLTTN